MVGGENFFEAEGEVGGVTDGANCLGKSEVKLQIGKEEDGPKRQKKERMENDFGEITTFFQEDKEDAKKDKISTKETLEDLEGKSQEKQN